MIVDFEKLSDTSRVFIFPAERKLYPEEMDTLKGEIEGFFETHPIIVGSFQVLLNRFIILGISETTPLGLSENDDLIEVILSLEKIWKISLLDKVKVFFKQGEYIQCKEIREFKKLIKSNSVSPKSVVFNNFVHNKFEFENNWELTAKESWVGHLF
jgi:hypothetical protein